MARVSTDVFNPSPEDKIVRFWASLALCDGHPSSSQGSKNRNHVPKTSQDAVSAVSWWCSSRCSRQSLPPSHQTQASRQCPDGQGPSAKKAADEECPQHDVQAPVGCQTLSPNHALATWIELKLLTVSSNMISNTVYTYYRLDNVSHPPPEPLIAQKGPPSNQWLRCHLLSPTKCSSFPASRFPTPSRPE